MSRVAEVSQDTFDAEVVKSQIPVLVDFWAPWCGPCLALAPTVEAVAAALDGRVKVVKCDIDQARALAQQYGVLSIPVLMLFKGGKVVEQMLGGNQRKEAILARVEKHLG